MNGERPRPKNCYARLAKEVINDQPDRNLGGFCDKLGISCTYCRTENMPVSASHPNKAMAKKLAREKARILRPCASTFGLLAPRSPF